MQIRLQYIRCCVLPAIFALLLGILIYIACRPSLPVFSRWKAVSAGIAWIRHHLPLTGSGMRIPGWIPYSLPDGLWAFAYAVLITGIWYRARYRMKYFWMASIPIFVAGFEILQSARVLPGTFSYQDLVAGVAGMLAGILYGMVILKNKSV